AMSLLPGLHATLAACVLRESGSCPLSGSHTFTVRSMLPEAMLLPSGLHATLRTGCLCPLRERTSRPFAASHTLMVQYPLGLRIRLLSGLHAPSNLDMPPGSPLSDSTSWPFSASHTFSVWFDESPVRMRLPSGLHARVSTWAVCPPRDRISRPPFASH